MPWHFVEHVPGVLWARPERAFGTRAPETPRRTPHPNPARDRSQPTLRVPLHRHTTPTNLAPHSATVRMAVAASWRTLAAPAVSAPPKPPALATCLLEQCVLIHSFVP